MALYRNLLNEVALVTGTPDPAHPVENIRGPQTYDYATGSANDWYLFGSFPALQTVDCVAFAAHNMGAGGCTLGIYTRVTAGSGAYTTAFLGVIPNDDATIIVLPPVELRDFLFVFTNATGIARIGVAFMGARMVFPGFIQPPYVPMNAADTVTIDPAISLGGHYLGGSVQRRGRQQNVTFSPMPRAFVDGDLRPFARHFNDGNPFFWAGSPAYMPDDAGYVWRGQAGGELRPSLLGGGLYADLTMGVDGYGA